MYELQGANKYQNKEAENAKQIDTNSYYVQQCKCCHKKRSWI